MLDVQYTSARGGEREQVPGACRRLRQRELDRHVLSGGEHTADLLGVQMVGRADQHRVHAGIREQPVEADAARGGLALHDARALQIRTLLERPQPRLPGPTRSDDPDP